MVKADAPVVMDNKSSTAPGDVRESPPQEFSVVHLSLLVSSGDCEGQALALRVKHATIFRDKRQANSAANVIAIHRFAPKDLGYE